MTVVCFSNSLHQSNKYSIQNQYKATKSSRGEYSYSIEQKYRPRNSIHSLQQMGLFITKSWTNLVFPAPSLYLKCSYKFKWLPHFHF